MAARARASKGRSARVGVSDHAGWAVLVTVGSDGAVLDRRRVALVDKGLPALPHHHEGSWAVGRYLDSPWARRITMPEALALVDRVRACAERRAREALEALAASLPVPVTALCLRACPPLPPTTEARIADNRAQTVADSVMYREALAAAAQARGWTVSWYDRETVLAESAAALRAVGRTVGKPWAADHKLAAAAALARPRGSRAPARPRARPKRGGRSGRRAGRSAR